MCAKWYLFITSCTVLSVYRTYYSRIIGYGLIYTHANWHLLIIICSIISCTAPVSYTRPNTNLCVLGLVDLSFESSAGCHIGNPFGSFNDMKGLLHDLCVIYV